MKHRNVISLIGTLAVLCALASCTALTVNGIPVSQGTRPGTPKGLFASITTATTINLRWLEQKDATSFTVIWADTKGITPEKAKAAGKTIEVDKKSSTDISGLEGGKTYYLKVIAHGASLDSLASGELAVPMAIPAAPLEASATIDPEDPTKIALAWAPTLGANTYSVYAVTAANASPSLTASVLSPEDDQKSTVRKVPVVIGKQSYHFAITAINAFGTSPFAFATIIITAGKPNLTATAISGKYAIKVDWKPVPAATQYRLSRSLTADFGSADSTSVIYEGTAAGPFIDDNKAANQTFFYKAIAVINSEASNPSEVVKATTALAPPEGLVAKSQSGSYSTHLAWTSLPGAQAYAIIRSSSSTASAEDTTISVAGNPIPTTWNDNNLEANREYFYRIASVRDSVASPGSAAVTIKSAPAIPRDLITESGDSCVTLKWTASSGASQYKIYYAQASDFNAAGLKVKLVSEATVTIGELNNGTTYYFKVTAINSDNLESPPSTIESNQPMLPDSTAPENLTANVAITLVGLSWNQPANTRQPAGYNVYRSETLPVPKATPIGSSKLAVYMDTTPEIGKTYYYVVTSYFLDKTESNASKVVKVVTVPNPVTNVAATVSRSTVTLKWTEAALATSYKIYRNTSGSIDINSPVHITINAAPFDTCTDASTALGTDYYYKVVACNAAGDAVAAPDKAVHAVTIPKAPVLNVLESAGTVELTWTQSSAATGYRIYRSTLSGTPAEGSLIKTIEGNMAQAYTDAVPPTGSKLYYRVCAFNASGDSDWSNEASP